MTIKGGDAPDHFFLDEDTLIGALRLTFGDGVNTITFLQTADVTGPAVGSDRVGRRRLAATQAAFHEACGSSSATGRSDVVCIQLSVFEET